MKAERVLVCIDAFYDGGAEMFAVRLANRLSTELNVYFLACRPELTTGNKQQKLLENTSVKYIKCTNTLFGDVYYYTMLFISRFMLKTKLRNYAKYWRLQYVCRENRIQVVNSHSWDSDSAFSKVKDKAKVKIVSSFHGHYELYEKSYSGFERETRFILDHTDAVVYSTAKHLATLDKYSFEKSKRHKIFYGLSMNVSNAANDYQKGQKLKLVMAARGIAEKGWYELVDAVKAIQNERGDVIELTLIGEGEAIQDLFAKNKNQTWLKFLGYKDDVLSYLNDAHVGLLPSYYPAESLPNSVIEYLAAGKPVIATNIGAIEEMLKAEEGIAGIVIPLEDGRVQSVRIKEAILQYLDHPDRLKKDSTLVAIAARKFDMEVCVGKYKQLFDQVVES